MHEIMGRTAQTDFSNQMLQSSGNALDMSSKEMLSKPPRGVMEGNLIAMGVEDTNNSRNVLGGASMFLQESSSQQLVIKDEDPTTSL